MQAEPSRYLCQIEGPRHALAEHFSLAWKRQAERHRQGRGMERLSGSGQEQERAGPALAERAGRAVLPFYRLKREARIVTSASLQADRAGSLVYRLESYAFGEAFLSVV